MSDFLFLPKEQEEFLKCVARNEWSNATNIIFEKLRGACLRVYRNAGSIFEGNYIEEDDFLNDQWINIYQYISNDKSYLDSENPMAYVIKHIQVYSLKLDSKDTDFVHLFQDPRYAGSQRVPYRQRIRYKDYREYSANSYEMITSFRDIMSDPTAELEGESDCQKYNDNEIDNTDIHKSLANPTDSKLTRKKIIDMMLMRIGDIAETIDFSELSISNTKEPAIFLLREEERV